MTATDTVAHLDRPAPQLCANLPMLENALLWTMRAWVIGHARRIDVSARIGAVFDRLGAPLAAPHLDRFMRLLSRSATRVLEVHCVCQPMLATTKQPCSIYSPCSSTRRTTIPSRYWRQ